MLGAANIRAGGLSVCQLARPMGSIALMLMWRAWVGLSKTAERCRGRKRIGQDRAAFIWCFGITLGFGVRLVELRKELMSGRMVASSFGGRVRASPLRHER